MTTFFWWSEPLRRWASEIGLTYEIERYVTPLARRASGDWFRNDGHWMVHLDDQHYAHFAESDIDTRLQKSFTWAIQMMSELRPPNWQEQLMTWMESLVSKPHHEIFLAGWDASSAPLPEKLPHRLPGYVVWLHLEPTASSDYHKIEEVKQTVTEILEAYLPNSLAGWMEDGTELSAVLFLSADLVNENHDASEVNEDEDPGEQNSHIRETLLELVQMIATDGLVACEMAVGAVVESQQQLYWGAATSIAAWRERAWMGRGSKVTMWMEQSITHLLGGLSDAACRTFVQIASLRAPTRNLSLGPDLVEALSGVVAANLNVSEAARLLYLHRNTLINRIERLKHETGYDIRNFTDAFTLWTVVSIQNRLKSESES